MKKTSSLIILLLMFLLIASCQSPIVFDIALKNGRYIGENESMKVTTTFKEIDIMQYVKQNNNVLKDQTTINEKFYKPFRVELKIEKDSKTYKIDLSKPGEQKINNNYKIYCSDKMELNLEYINLKLIDRNSDTIAEEINCDLKFLDETITLSLYNNDEKHQFNIHNPFNLDFTTSISEDNKVYPDEIIYIKVMSDIEDIYLSLSTNELVQGTLVNEYNSQYLLFEVVMPNENLDIIINSDTLALDYKYYIENPLYARFKNFSFNKPIDENINYKIIDLGDIIYDGTLQELFAAPFGDQYLVKNYCGLYIKRTEPWYMSIANITYSDLYLENSNLYITYNYDKEFPEVIIQQYIPDVDFYELILIPKIWKEKINFHTLYPIKINKIYPNKEELFLTYDVLDKIKNVYINESSDVVFPNNLHVRGLYQKDETAIFMITCDLYDYPAYIETKTYGEYSFSFDASYSLHVYQEDKHYTIDEALELNIITMNDVSRAHSRSN